MKSEFHFKFEDLQVYSKSLDFGERVNSLVKNFPKSERFELTSQFKRAVDSISLNIAEGAAGTDAQFHNFLGTAWLSAHECVTCSTKAKLRSYLTFDEDEENRRLITELSKMITV